MIAIPNMEKPKECGHRDMFIEHNSICHCYLTGSHITFVGEVADDCPLTEIDLVRCGECKWFIEQGKGNVGKCTYRTRPMLYCLPTDFCSYAEGK